MIKFSFILPVFVAENWKKNLKYFVSHLSKQSVASSAFEVVIVDATNLEGKVEALVASERDKLPHLSIVTATPELVSSSAAGFVNFGKLYNLGLAQAQGEFVIFAQVDTRYNLEFLQKISHLSHDHPELAVFRTSVALHSDNPLNRDQLVPYNPPAQNLETKLRSAIYDLAQIDNVSANSDPSWFAETDEFVASFVYRNVLIKDFNLTFNENISKGEADLFHFNYLRALQQAVTEGREYSFDPAEAPEVDLSAEAYLEAIAAKSPAELADEAEDPIAKAETEAKVAQQAAEATEDSAEATASSAQEQADGQASADTETAASNLVKLVFRAGYLPKAVKYVETLAQPEASQLVDFNKDHQFSLIADYFAPYYRESFKVDELTNFFDKLHTLVIDARAVIFNYLYELPVADFEELDLAGKTYSLTRQQELIEFFRILKAYALLARDLGVSAKFAKIVKEQTKLKTSAAEVNLNVFLQTVTANPALLDQAIRYFGGDNREALTLNLTDFTISEQVLLDVQALLAPPATEEAEVEVAPETTSEAQPEPELGFFARFFRWLALLFTGKKEEVAEAAPAQLSAEQEAALAQDSVTQAAADVVAAVAESQAKFNENKQSYLTGRFINNTEVNQFLYFTDLYNGDNEKFLSITTNAIEGFDRLLEDLGLKAGEAIASGRVEDQSEVFVRAVPYYYFGVEIGKRYLLNVQEVQSYDYQAYLKVLNFCEQLSAQSYAQDRYNLHKSGFKAKLANWLEGDKAKRNYFLITDLTATPAAEESSQATETVVAGSEATASADASQAGQAEATEAVTTESASEVAQPVAPATGNKLVRFLDNDSLLADIKQLNESIKNLQIQALNTDTIRNNKAKFGSDLEANLKSYKYLRQVAIRYGNANCLFLRLSDFLGVNQEQGLDVLLAELFYSGRLLVVVDVPAWNLDLFSLNRLASFPNLQLLFINDEDYQEYKQYAHESFLLNLGADQNQEQERREVVASLLNTPFIKPHPSLGTGAAEAASPDLATSAASEVSASAEAAEVAEPTTTAENAEAEVAPAEAETESAPVAEGAESAEESSASAEGSDQDTKAAEEAASQVEEAHAQAEKTAK